jgi:BCD family chlorophyll transporter-like MFS transporter
MVGSSAILGLLLSDFSQIRLIQVIQGAAVLTVAFNLIALWKQEARRPSRPDESSARPSFRDAWRDYVSGGRSGRLLVSIGLGTAGFSMQDILLEPYGGQVLGMSVGATTALTALLAGGTLIAFAVAARQLTRGGDAYRLSAVGALLGVLAFTAVIFAAPLESALLFRSGVFLIGFGGGLFAVGTLTAAMDQAKSGQSGLALGAWGAAQASAAGAAIAFGGVARDLVAGLAEQGVLGPALTGAATGYGFVYHLEIALLFATLAAIGPLVGSALRERREKSSTFGLADFPG